MSAATVATREVVTGRAEPDRLDVAMELVTAGWFVFPARTASKLPAVPHGFKDATNDPAQVWDWFTQHPTWNVCVATGASRLVVIDLDVSVDGDGHCAEALTSFCALAAEHGGDLPATYEVLTPRGGEHWYFAVPADIEPPRNSTSKLAPHVDVRAEGGYVVAAGSVLNNGAYVVGADRPVADAPRWLIELCRPPAPTPAVRTSTATDVPRDRDSAAQRRLAGVYGKVAMAPVGKRNDVLFWGARTAGELVVARDIGLAGAVDGLVLAAQRAGLEWHETKATIRSGLRAAGIGWEGP